MELKPGYKQTEVGVIPEDWEVIPLISCLSSTPNYGINAPAVPYSDRLPAYIRITDISEDGQFLSHNPVSVKSINAAKYFLSDGDIVFARTGASVGKSYRYKLADGSLVFAGFLIRVHPDPTKLLPSFVAAYVTTGNYLRWVSLMSMRSGQPGINGKEYSLLPIPKPPLPEQRSIATALSDMDELLGGLDRLITKKRDLKQSAMQLLLTGKIRLPEFDEGKGYKQTEIGVISEDWKIQTLLEVCIKIQDGTHFSPSIGGNEYLYITSKNIGFGILKLDNTDRIDELQHRKIYHRCDVKKGDILLTKDGVNTGNAALNTLDEEFSLLSSVAFLRFDQNKYDASYFLQQILSSEGQQRMKDLMSGNAITRLTLQKIHKISFPVPPLPEQTAIASILSDMDTEIATLEQRRNKTRDLKQAMMQELLTGRIRLL